MLIKQRDEFTHKYAKHTTFSNFKTDLKSITNYSTAKKITSEMLIY